LNPTDKLTKEALTKLANPKPDTENWLMSMYQPDESNPVTVEKFTSVVTVELLKFQRNINDLQDNRKSFGRSQEEKIKEVERVQRGLSGKKTQLFVNLPELSTLTLRYRLKKAVSDFNISYTCFGSIDKEVWHKMETDYQLSTCTMPIKPELQLFYIKIISNTKRYPPVANQFVKAIDLPKTLRLIHDSLDRDILPIKSTEIEFNPNGDNADPKMEIVIEQTLSLSWEFREQAIKNQIEYEKKLKEQYENPEVLKKEVELLKERVIPFVDVFSYSLENHFHEKNRFGCDTCTIF